MHRDVKPANVLIGRDRRVKLADFGIAKAVQGATASLTATGQIIGTPAYLLLDLPQDPDHGRDAEHLLREIPKWVENGELDPNMGTLAIQILGVSFGGSLDEDGFNGGD